MNITKQLLTFWFGTPDVNYKIEKRDVWFKATPEFDASIIKNFRNAYEEAATDKLNYLAEEESGCLALILLLDQIPRNLFRNSSKAYATDNKAKSIAQIGITSGYDKKMSPWHRVFFYLPFQHSEILADQNYSVQLFESLGLKTSLEAARDHQQIIKQFGRFPYRNKALGRLSTQQEEEYLLDPPPWGKTKAEMEELEQNNNLNNKIKKL